MFLALYRLAIFLCSQEILLIVDYCALGMDMAYYFLRMEEEGKQKRMYFRSAGESKRSVCLLDWNCLLTADPPLPQDIATPT